MNLSPVFDIVLGDFGRDASIEYCRIAALEERRLISRLLERGRMQFFDEYRRSMFVLVSAIEFLKRPQIAEAQGRGHIDESILVGLAGTEVSDYLVEATTGAVAQQWIFANRCGYRRVRLVIPCNGLSPILDLVVRRLRDPVQLSEIVADTATGWRVAPTFDISEVEIYELPLTVTRELADEQANRDRPWVVLGTRGTNLQYARTSQAHGVRLVALSDDQYAVLDRAIVASIGGEAEEIESTRREIESRILAPVSQSVGEALVIEACTDFRYGLGKSSLEVFAKAMVHDVYGGE